MNFELKQISHYMFFPPVELCSRGEVFNGNKPNEQTVCLALMSTGQNKVISQMVRYFKYCKSINMYDHPHDTGDQSSHKNLHFQSNSTSCQV